MYNQQWTNQNMIYYPSFYQMPSQDHMGVHPAVSMPQPGNPGVPQVIYQAQQMQVNKSVMRVWSMLTYILYILMGFFNNW